MKSVSRYQVRKLKKTVEARQQCDGKDVYADLPIYYSTRKVSKQKDARPNKSHDKSGERRASAHCMSTRNRGHGKRDGSSDHSSNSDFDGSSDDEYKKDDMLHCSNKEVRKRLSRCYLNLA